jgi:hypothetical protein
MALLGELRRTGVVRIVAVQSQTLPQGILLPYGIEHADSAMKRQQIQLHVPKIAIMRVEADRRDQNRKQSKNMNLQKLSDKIEANGICVGGPVCWNDLYYLQAAVLS